MGIRRSMPCTPSTTDPQSNRKPTMIQKLITEIKATMGIYESDADNTYGLLAEFADPGALYHAASDVRKEGYRKFDTYSPFPIHGMDHAMGLGNSKVGFLTLGGGLTGLALATWLQWWTGSVDYPINISGKPYFAIEPSIPIMFELTILFAALATVAGMFALNGLPRPYNPLFYSDRFRRVTDDGFFLAVAANDGQFDIDETEAFLKGIGAVHVEVIKDYGNAE
jgi:hypothetical protein